MIERDFDLNTYSGRVGHMIHSYGAPAAKELLGYNKSKIYRYMKDAEHMNFIDVTKLADAAGFSWQWLKTGEGESKKGAHLSLVPSVLVRFMCNEDRPPINFSPEFLEELGVNQVSAAILRVEDDSMLDLYKPGDIVLVDADRFGSNGIYGLNVNGTAMVKRLQFLPNGDVKVISENKAYENFTMTQSELEESVVIFGQVVWRGGS